MKKLIILPVLACALLGILSGKIIYDNYIDTTSVMGENKENIVYFLQEGVYTNHDIAVKNQKDYEGSIILKEDNKYYLYVGITHDKDNASKIIKIYEKDNIPLYLRELVVNNFEFISSLEQYDVILKGATEKHQILEVMEVILESYEEIVLKE